MVKFNVAERIALLNVLPPIGSAATLRIIRELQGELSFTEDELKHFGIKIIIDTLKKLDLQGQLHVTMLPLYERFVEGKE